MRRYVWQLHGWPALTWDQEALAGPLTRAAARRGELYGALRNAAVPDEHFAEVAAVTAEAIQSSAIEGEELDPEATRSSVAQQLGFDIGGTRPPDRKTDGVVEMLIDATQNFDAPLTTERLRYWHDGLFVGSEEPWRGRFRTQSDGDEQVVTGPFGRQRVLYEAPPGARVTSDMARFLEWFNQTPSVNGLLDSALAHLWFVTIHPFVDGNGRIARAIADAALARSERSGKRYFSMSAQIRTERAAYYAALQRIQRGSMLDVTSWMEWYAGCYARAIEASLHVIDDIVMRSRFWVVHASTTLNERQRRTISRLLGDFEGHMTTKKWATMNHVSIDTASRDINELVEAGMLARAGAARSTHFELTPPARP